jgi:hypothetical protein
LPDSKHSNLLLVALPEDSIVLSVLLIAVQIKLKLKKSSTSSVFLISTSQVYLQIPNSSQLCPLKNFLVRSMVLSTIAMVRLKLMPRNTSSRHSLSMFQRSTRMKLWKIKRKMRKKRRRNRLTLPALLTSKSRFFR